MSSRCCATGSCTRRGTRAPGTGADPPRARQRTLDNPGQHADRSSSFPERGLIRRRAARDTENDNELGLLERRVAAAAGKPDAMALLAELMGPGGHHSATGLMATRMYTQLLDI
ncbi:hypothetical protein G4G28_11710 [Massilia sp. Dwa41.01b]|uniref:hypothetical protein n=1 Tax=Massilia sp. Dwa41.01b TaxID=2709302 RepID=UPI0016004230|nr:hypothetical protein [Massilia sp. Dwa41.01b]QNA88981.1 hypothetical protein G4G28_11710 [Massilia sp. Dwa41.01b]